MIVPTKDITILSNFPEVCGVFVGGCVERGEGSRFRAKAHSHTTGDHAGWICFLSAKRLLCRELFLHEIAHVLTGEGHTDKWRERLLQIGGTLEEVPGILKSYKKRARIPANHVPCKVCGRRDLPLHVDRRCPECAS